MPARKRALAGRLDKIVSLDAGPRQPAREAAKPREYRYQLVAEPLASRILVRNSARRRSCHCMPERQRTS
jgi:hypothetical protein